MKQEGLMYFTDIHWTYIALIIFFTCFLGILLWSFRSTGKNHYEKMASLPLKETTHE